jgi:hypothetical protein
MPITRITNNPRLIPPEGLWRLAQVSVEYSRKNFTVHRIKGDPKATEDFLTLCEAINEAVSRNTLISPIWNKDKLPFWSVFDDRGVFIYLQTWVLGEENPPYTEKLQVPKNKKMRSTPARRPKTTILTRK